jgi:uncharacterized membrane protein
VRRIYSIRPTWSLQGRRFLGVRGVTGKPFHPPLTDVPIVSFAIAAVFDVISCLSDASHPRARDFFVAATFVMVVGAVGGFLAMLTGFFDWWKGIPRDQSTGWPGKAERTQVWRTINWHATVMIVVMVLTLLGLTRRIPNFEQLRARSNADPLAGAVDHRSGARPVRRRVRRHTRVRVRLRRGERRRGLGGVRGGSGPGTRCHRVGNRSRIRSAGNPASYTSSRRARACRPWKGGMRHWKGPDSHGATVG